MYGSIMKVMVEIKLNGRLTIIVRGETYIITLKISERTPTTNDLWRVPCNASIVIRATAAKKTTSMRRKISSFF